MEYQRKWVNYCVLVERVGVGILMLYVVCFLSTAFKYDTFMIEIHIFIGPRHDNVFSQCDSYLDVNICLINIV